MEAADLKRPVVIAEMAPNYRGYLPDIREEDWPVRGYVRIDGQHRLEKARRMGIQLLPAVTLRIEQHIPFLYASYEQYVEYCNGRLKNRVEDVHCTRK